MQITGQIARVWLWAGLLFSFTELQNLSALAAAPRVPGFERFYAEAPSIEGGRLLFRELNCVACHRSESSELAKESKIAPHLDDLGSRVRPDWIRQFLLNPHAVKPGSTMPDLLKAVSGENKAKQVEALTHFLASTGTVSDVLPDKGAAQRGQKAFHRVGCAACHNPLVEEAPDLATSVALPILGAKYTATSLQQFLKDPLKVRPGGRMPALGLKDEEYRDIAHYFVSDVLFEPNVKFSVYHGRWKELPDFSVLKPARTGDCGGFDLTVAKKTASFAVRYETQFVVQQPGQHQFYLGSDDGSRLTVDGNVVVMVDGVHPHQEQMGKANLDRGPHRVLVEYFQDAGEWTLTLDVAGPGLKRQPLAGLATLHPGDATKQPKTFVANPELVAQGQALFTSLGCASCHQMKSEGQRLASTFQSPSLKQCQPSQGCVAETPSAKSAHYSLNTVQRESLSLALTELELPAEKSARVQHTLTQFNCYACHQRGERGGVEEARNPYFETLIQEMGDEGRLPPTLTGVGDKLRPEWMQELFQKGANDRQSYMQTRMPRFGLKNVAHLVDDFAKLDQLTEPSAVAPFPEPDYRIKAYGRHLVGAQALSCIKCHDFGSYPAQGIRSINLATMTKRLRPDWFHRYVLNPQTYRPGTRMPSAWPFGQTTIKSVLKANVDWQVDAVWLYLTDGDKAAVPVGMVREPIELVAEKTPVLYRNFIEGAGARAIGVGYPERANLAWDADQMRPALIWHGAFLDAARHWNGRGVGFEAPLGDHVLKLVDGLPLAVLNTPDESWPTGKPRELGYRFLGYSLNTEQQPVFRYRWGEVVVEDVFLPVAEAGRNFPVFHRRLEFQGSLPGNRWFRAAQADKIEALGDDLYQIDGTWQLKAPAGSQPQLREVNQKQELLFPVQSQEGKAMLEFQYLW